MADMLVDNRTGDGSEIVGVRRRSRPRLREVPWLKEVESYKDKYSGLVPFGEVRYLFRYKSAENELGAGFEGLVESVFYGKGMRNPGGFTAEELIEFVIRTDGFYGCNFNIFAMELGLNVRDLLRKIRNEHVYKEELINGGDEHFLDYHLLHPVLGVLAVELLRVSSPVGGGFWVKKGVFLFRGRSRGEIYFDAVADCIGLRA